MAMKENKDKERYEAPCTRRTQVCLESGICAGSANVTNDNTDNGRIDAHQVNDDFNFSFSEGQDWENMGSSQQY